MSVDRGLLLLSFFLSSLFFLCFFPSLLPRFLRPSVVLGAMLSGEKSVLPSSLVLCLGVASFRRRHAISCLLSFCPPFPLFFSTRFLSYVALVLSLFVAVSPPPVSFSSKPLLSSVAQLLTCLFPFLVSVVFSSFSSPLFFLLSQDSSESSFFLVSVVFFVSVLFFLPSSLSSSAVGSKDLSVLRIRQSLLSV